MVRFLNTSLLFLAKYIVLKILSFSFIKRIRMNYFLSSEFIFEGNLAFLEQIDVALKEAAVDFLFNKFVISIS
jgi:hypothetical protein